MSGEAERVACGVQQNPPLIGLRLERGLDGAQGQHVSVGNVQVLYAEFDVRLLAVRRVGPGGGAGSRPAG